MSSARFRREMRLATARDFGRVFKGPARSGDRLLTVLAKRNQLRIAGNRVGRLGIAVAKRHLSRAVDRNRTKRAIRESFRQHQQRLRGLDIVVLSAPGLRSASTREVHESLLRHWEQVSHRCKAP